MPDQPLSFSITFRDFKFLQTHMARRLFAKNRSGYARALLGICLCAILLGLVIAISVEPYRVSNFTAFGQSQADSVYLLIVLCLVAAIGSLIPAVRLRFRTLRMQVSDDGPFLGPTQVHLEMDGLRVDRPKMSAKYLWAAFQRVDMAKNAVILALDNGIGLIVPASAFPSDAARYEFAASVAKQMESAKAQPSVDIVSR